MAVSLTPLSGSAAATQSGRSQKNGSEPLCYLLELDEARILLDCGARDWAGDEARAVVGGDEMEEEQERDRQYEEKLKSLAPTIDLVLLSHASIRHAGLYAYARARLGLTAPAYASLPVKEMARIATAEDTLGWRAERDIDAQEDEYWIPKLEEIREAWASVKDVRYHQPQHLTGKLKGLTLTAFSSGHTLGGTLWKIRSPASGTVLYAVGLNHMKERHLDGTVLLRGSDAPGGGVAVHEQLVRPGLVITDTERGSCVNAKRKDRDSALLELITITLLENHSVLIPCDPTTRVLELLVLFDQHWTFSRDKDPTGFRFPLCLVSQTGDEMLKFVRGLMEWFGGAAAAGEGPREDAEKDKGKWGRRDREGKGVLDFKPLHVFPTIAALNAAFPADVPKLVLATPPNFSYGSSRRLFAEFARNGGDLVVLTQRGAPGSLARGLFERWDAAQPDDRKWGKGKIGDVVQSDWALRLRMHKKVPLEGAELQAHLDAEQHARDQEAARQAAEARKRRMIEADEEESDDESDSDREVDDALGGRNEEDEFGTPGETGRRAGVTFAEPGSSSRKRGGGVGAFPLATGATGDLPEAGEVSFDIYLKGHSTRAASFFKSASSGAPRFRMFPFVERRRRVDEYGEVIDVDAWISRGKELASAAAEDQEERETKRRRLEEEERNKQRAEPPSKYVTEDLELQMVCRVFYVDMEGLNDGRAIRTIMPQLNPRKMILVSGPKEASDALIDSFGAIAAMTKEVHAPALGEPVKIGEHTHSFSFTLGESLLANLQMAPFEDFLVAHVTGQISYNSESSIPILGHLPVAPAAASTTEASSGTSVASAAAPDAPTAPLPSVPQRTLPPLPSSLFVGDLKLTALKARLEAQGVQAEFGGEGVLVCSKEGGGAVAVTKNAQGNLVIEGGLVGRGEAYYLVRDTVYSMHAVV